MYFDVLVDDASSAARADSIDFARRLGGGEELEAGPIEVARRSIAKASGTPRAPTMRTWKGRREGGG